MARARMTSLLDDPTIVPVPVPHDCVAYLNPTVQAGMSIFSLTPKPALQEGLSRLRADLASGEWDRNHEGLRDSQQLDLGYRLLIAELHY
jgi:hypothetical protein